MGNCLFAFPDFSQPTSVVTPTITGTSGWVDLGNLQGRVLSEMAHWPSASAGSITVDMGTLRGVQVFYIPKHTALPGNTVRVRLYTDAGLTNLVMDSGVCQFWPTAFEWGSLPFGDPRWFDGRLSMEDAAGYNLPWVYIHLSQVVGRYAKWDFDFTGNANGCADIARVGAAPALQPRYNMSYGNAIGWRDASQYKASLGGADFSDVRENRRQAVISLDWLDVAESFGALWELDRICGTHAPFFFITDPDDGAMLFKRSFMSRIEQLEPFAHPNFNRKTKSYKLLEWL